MKGYLPLISSFFFISNVSLAQETEAYFSEALDIDKPCVLQSSLVGPPGLYSCATSQSKLGSGTLSVDLSRAMQGKAPETITCEWVGGEGVGAKVRRSGDGDVQNGYELVRGANPQQYTLHKVGEPNSNFVYKLPFEPIYLLNPSVGNVNHFCYADPLGY